MSSFLDILRLTLRTYKQYLNNVKRLFWYF